MRNLFCTFVLLTFGLICFSQTDFPHEIISKQDFSKPAKSQIKTTPVWEVTFEEETPVWTFGSTLGSKTWNVGDTTPTNGFMYQGNPAPPLWWYMGQRYVKDFSVSGNNFAYIDGVSDLLGLFPTEVCESYVLFDNIDLSGTLHPKLSFYQNYKGFNYDQCFVDFSNDEGLTWVSVELNIDVEWNSFGPEMYEMLIPEQFISSTDFMMRFRWNCPNADPNYGMGYGWQLDDISICENPDFDLSLVDARMNFFEYVDYTEAGYEQYFHYSSHYGKIPQQQFSSDLANSWFNVIVKNKGNVDILPEITCRVYDPFMNEIFLYSSTFETSVIGSFVKDTVDLYVLDFHPGNDPAIGRYTVVYSVSCGSEADANPEDNTFTSYFDITENEMALFLNEPTASVGPYIYSYGGNDGEQIGAKFTFLYEDIINSVDVYIAENSTVGTSFVCSMMKFDEEEQLWLAFTSSLIYTIQESDLGQWVNVEFADPALVDISEGSSSVSLLCSFELYYGGIGALYLGYDPTVPSSNWGTMWQFQDGDNAYDWIASEWNKGGLGIKLNMAGLAVDCPENISVCLNSSPFVIADAIPVGATFSGDGVEGNMFYPASAGVGEHLITLSYQDLQCNFFITVNILPSAVTLTKSPENGILLPATYGSVTLLSSNSEYEYWTTQNDVLFFGEVSGNGEELNLGTDYQQGTFYVNCRNEFGCTAVVGDVTFIENDGTAKIVVNSTIGSEAEFLQEGDFKVHLYQSHLDEYDVVISEIVAEQLAGPGGYVIFEDINPGTYFLRSEIVDLNYNQFALSMFYFDEMIFDEASSIEMTETTFFTTSINHPLMTQALGTNYSYGSVVSQSEGKAVNALEGKVVILKDVDNEEIIDISITDTHGNYHFYPVPDFTNIQIFVTMPESPIWIAYSAMTSSHESFIVNFLADGNTVYPAFSFFDEALNETIEFFISPNPCVESIEINSETNMKFVKVFTTTGQLVISEFGAEIKTLNVSKLPVGSYILVGIDESNNVGVAKFVKN